MSRGRGRGGGAASAIANALGISRADIPQGYRPNTAAGPPPLYPPLNVKPLPLPASDDLQYMAELKQELLNRFQESPSYLEDIKSTRNDTKRYNRPAQKEPLAPHWDRLPKELRIGLAPKEKLKQKKDSPPKKKPRKDLSTVDITTLQELEKKEKLIESKATDDKKEKTGEDEDKEKDQDEDEKNVSDDDYLEEDNDYIENYFDNGEGYLEDSEDNIDDDAVF